MELSETYQQRLLCALNSVINQLNEQLDGKNNAFMIYKDLYLQLQEKNIDEFLNDNNDIWMQTFQLHSYAICHHKYVSASSFEEKKKIGLNLLGDYMESLLKGRFHKEKSEPNVEPNIHMLKWFNENSQLDNAKDKIAVQSAFIAIFLIIQHCELTTL